MFIRPMAAVLETRLRESRRFIQVLAGPRQVGKTTLARQVVGRVGLPVHFASADEPALRDRIWIEQQWEAARARAEEAGEPGAATSMTR
jgi:predicted AAA+ superfamily ATPase